MPAIITASDLSCGDLVMNCCDPDFLSVKDQNEATMQVYKMVSYAVFADRIIVPSRYLFASTPATFEAFTTLQTLLNAGILIPDLRVGYGSFTEFVRARRSDSVELYRRAQWLDENASVVYHFDVAGQSDLYRQHLVDDLDVNHGTLARILLERGAEPNHLQAAQDCFYETDGNRKAFVSVTSSLLPEYESYISKWAAFRYYATPAEIEGIAIRDMPLEISEFIRKEGVSDPKRFLLKDARDPRTAPQDCVHQILMALPKQASVHDLAPLGDIVLETKRQMPSGPAKFKTISEIGFGEDVEDINALFLEEIMREQNRFPDTLFSRIRSAAIGEAPFWTLEWSLGMSVPPGADAIGSLLWGEVTHGAGTIVKKELNPLTETSQYFGKLVKKTSKKGSHKKWGTISAEKKE